MSKLNTKLDELAYEAYMAVAKTKKAELVGDTIEQKKTKTSLRKASKYLKEKHGITMSYEMLRFRVDRYILMNEYAYEIFQNFSYYLAYVLVTKYQIYKIRHIVERGFDWFNPRDRIANKSLEELWDFLEKVEKGEIEYETYRKNRV